LSALFYYIFKENPDMFSHILNQPTERLSFISSDESLLQRLDRWAIPILGSLVAQEVISRMLAAKNVKVATRSCYYAAFIYIFIGCLPILFGLIGPQIINFDIPNKEHFIIALANHYLPVFLMPIFAGALISALLATIDSILISVSGLFAHNYLIPKFKIQNEKKKVLVTRLSVVGSASIAYLLAYNSDSIYALLEIASSFGTSGILIITIAGLWFRNSEDKIALATLVIGLVSTPLYEYVLELDAPFILGILTCLVFYVVSTYALIPLKVFKASAKL
jgi:Na+/proline symporter